MEEMEKKVQNSYAQMEHFSGERWQFNLSFLNIKHVNKSWDEFVSMGREKKENKFQFSILFAMFFFVFNFPSQSSDEIKLIYFVCFVCFSSFKLFILLLCF